MKKLCNANAPTKEVDLCRMEKEVQKHVGGLLSALQIDWRHDHNMKDTPARVAKSLVRELFKGRYEEPPKSTDFPNVKSFDEVMALGPIDVKSTCAHHLLPVYGSAWIGVLPNVHSRLIGLSKFNRIVEHFSRRPQIQEELTEQIADYLEDILRPNGLIVVIKAKHFCICSRGVNQNSDTITSVARGSMKTNTGLKSEFFSLLRSF